ncbi:hypothetical protein [Micromonospora sp. HUAS LYJ1]|uniref:hypothetical protein n=1 Tax=Micromonospora sp. HUAS LYJ1 TaxID=3061626 RepID=UPI0026720ADD|nr:hypothetical protein [Micromonospora sp. HUAS LYJ1]WKU08009.1 hypothetical protein Q2K16_13750 [Micromonospora sp. HUAS LYJ1]
MAYSVIQGRTVTLTVEWLDYPGGPASLVSGVTIEIRPAGGGVAVVGPTSTGVVHVATGLDTYRWTVPADLAASDYAVIWSGTDAQADTVTATDIVTVVEQSPPVGGSYATVAELAEHLGRTPTNAVQLLVRASRDVDRALLCAVYDPTDPAVVTALREATLEQVAGNLGSGNTTGLGGSRQGGFSIGRLTVQAASSDDKPVRIGSLWEQAWTVLQAAGLTGHGPQSR